MMIHEWQYFENQCGDAKLPVLFHGFRRLNFQHSILILKRDAHNGFLVKNGLILILQKLIVAMTFRAWD